MQISDSSSRILAGLLEARTGQQLTMSRRWRIETALSALLGDLNLREVHDDEWRTADPEGRFALNVKRVEDWTVPE